MNEKVYAPQIDSYIEMYGRRGYNGANNITYDEESYTLLNSFFKELHKISPISENGCREIWVCAERGNIEAYGDYYEWFDSGAGESFEEFEKEWKEFYPHETKWYNIEAVDTEDGFQAVVVNNILVIEIRPDTEKGYPHNIKPFTSWLLKSVKECIIALKNGTYLDNVRNNLPDEHKTGTILQSELWDIYPEDRTEFFDGLSDIDIEEIKSFIEKQPKMGYKPNGRIKSVTANDFYNFCSIGYKAMSYKWYGMTPKEQYYKYSDGRDEELSTIDPDSEKAFREWLTFGGRGYGHPWEVCRGGNTTHISLQVDLDDDGYYLHLAGSSYGRANETLKFFLALSRAKLPVFLHDADIFTQRLQGTEKVGIVPMNVIPKYCSSYFPNERVISYMNLPIENPEVVARKCVWQDIKEVYLIETEDKENGRK